MFINFYVKIILIIEIKNKLFSVLGYYKLNELMNHEFFLSLLQVINLIINLKI